MPRLRQVGKDAAHPLAQTVYKMLFGERDPVKEPGTETGTPGNWWTVFALVPDVFDHAVAGFQLYRSPNRKLDPKYREPLILYYLENMDYKEISDILQIPVSTVGVRLARARAQLRKVAGEDPRT